MSIVLTFNHEAGVFPFRVVVVVVRLILWTGVPGFPMNTFFVLDELAVCIG